MAARLKAQCDQLWEKCRVALKSYDQDTYVRCFKEWSRLYRLLLSQ